MMPVMRQLLAMAITACSAAGLACAQAPAEAPFTMFGRSTLVSVAAARLAPDTLTLRVRHADQTAVVPLQVEATAAGRNLPVTANADGTVTVSLKDLRGTPPARLDLLISHDGIRELISGKLAAPAAAGAARGTAAGLLRDHKQMAWWILNIAIVLIAAIAISRRMS